MPDPGFDFTRGGIGAEPLPPIDFSAGFKYLQDQQALALQQSRALLSHQGKMAQITVDQDTLDFRWAQLEDDVTERIVLERWQKEKRIDDADARLLKREQITHEGELSQNRMDMEENRIDDHGKDRKDREATRKYNERIATLRNDRDDKDREAREAIRIDTKVHRGQQREDFLRELEYKEDKLDQNSKDKAANLKYLREALAERTKARESGDKRHEAEIDIQIAKLENRQKDFIRYQEQLLLDIDKLNYEKKKDEEDWQREDEQRELDWEKHGLAEKVYDLRSRIAEDASEATGRSGAMLRKVGELREAALASGSIEEANKNYLEMFVTLGQMKGQEGKVEEVYLPSIPRTARTYLLENEGKLSEWMRLKVTANMQSLEAKEAKEYGDTDLPQFKETWGSAIRRADKATSNIPEVDDGKGGTRPTSWGERVGVFFQTLYGELGQSVQDLSKYIKQGPGHRPEAAQQSLVIARTNVGRTANSTAIIKISDEATNLSSAISGPKGLSESLALAEGNLGGDEGVYEKPPEMERVAKSLLNLAKTPEEKLAAWRGVIGEMGYDNKTEIESRLDILLDHRDDKGNRVISPKDIKESVMDNPVALSLLLGDTLFQDAYLDENPGEAMTAAQIRRYSTTDVRNHMNDAMAEHFEWKVVSSQTTTEDGVLISRNLSVFDDEDVQEKAAELWFKFRDISNQAEIFAHQMALEFEKRPGSLTLIPKEKSPMLMLATTLSGTTAERIDTASSRVRSNFQQWALDGNRSVLGLEYDKMNFHPVPGTNKFWVEHFPDAMGERIDGLFDPFSTGGQ